MAERRWYRRNRRLLGGAILLVGLLIGTPGPARADLPDPGEAGPACWSNGLADGSKLLVVLEFAPASGLRLLLLMEWRLPEPTGGIDFTPIIGGRIDTPGVRGRLLEQFIAEAAGCSVPLLHREADPAGVEHLWLDWEGGAADWFTERFESGWSNPVPVPLAGRPPSVVRAAIREALLGLD